MNAVAKRATFDRASQNRRSMYAKIQIAKKDLQIDEDDYRQMLLDTTGEISLKKCIDAQLVKMIDLMKSKGWKAMPSKKKTADHPAAGKARALWISLYHLNAIRNPSEQALEAFARRQLNVTKMQWADQGLMYKLIEALKAMAERHGWSQQLETQTNGNHQILLLQRCLCFAILSKLQVKGLAAANWNLEDAAFRLTGQQLSSPTEVQELTQLAKSLGDKLRESAS